MNKKPKKTEEIAATSTELFAALRELGFTPREQIQLLTTVLAMLLDNAEFDTPKTLIIHSIRQALLKTQGILEKENGDGR